GWVICSAPKAWQFGVLLIATPGAGPLAVVVVIAAFGEFFGVLLVLLALRLRKTSSLKA
ncbi:HdeD family acid-resistance protein, partial [Pseudomonas aeruginosa]